MGDQKEKGEQAMKQTIYICDRCKEQIKGNPIRMVPMYIDRESGGLAQRPEGDPNGYEGQMEKEYCQDCVGRILMFANGSLREKTKGNKGVDGKAGDLKTNHQDVLLHKEEKSTAPAQRGIAAQITALYREGRTMEEISAQLHVGLPTVSRCVHKAGLGDERYKGQTIPSNGSAMAAQCNVYQIRREA